MSPFIQVKPTDRQHMLVWKTRYYDERPWRVSRALNGIPIGFGLPCATWREAMDRALSAVTP